MRYYKLLHCFVMNEQLLLLSRILSSEKLTYQYRPWILPSKASPKRIKGPLPTDYVNSSIQSTYKSFQLKTQNG